MDNRTRDGKLVVIQCKDYGANRLDLEAQLAAYLVGLRSTGDLSSITVAVTRPDLDHGSSLLIGDAAQVQAHHTTNYDIDVVAYVGEAVRMREPFEGKTESAAPVLGRIILGYVCPLDRLEAVLGDLDENFRTYATEYGLRAARRWYWWQVARSAGVFCLRLLSSIGLLYELLKRLGL